ncbi:MAG: YeeE/YedE family protein [Gemmatimonadota bacterium]
MPAEVTAADLPGLRVAVLWSTFGLAFVFGAVAQRTTFCTMGSVADIVNFGDWTRMRQWLLAIAVAILGTNALAATGVIDLTKTIYTAPRFTLASYVLGGLAFGLGMVLAGGCGSRTLVRLGSGSLKSLVVFVVLGITAFITLRGALGVIRAAAIDPIGVQFASTQDLPTLLAGATGAGRTKLQWIVSATAAGALLAFVFARRDFFRFDNLLAGLAIGAVIVGVWYVSGHVGHLAEHPETLEETFLATNSGRMESLSFVAPIAYTFDWLMFFSDTSKRITLGIAAVFGMVAGSAAYALASRSFRWEGFRDTEDTASHIVGAMLMGFGGVTALGCTVGQGLSGVSTLSLGSLVAWLSIITGAVGGLKYQAWRLGRSA